MFRGEAVWNVVLAIQWVLQAAMIWAIGPRKISEGMALSQEMGLTTASVFMVGVAAFCIYSNFRPNRYLRYTLIVVGLAWGGGGMLAAIEQGMSPVGGVNVAWATSIIFGAITARVTFAALMSGARIAGVK